MCGIAGVFVRAEHALDLRRAVAGMTGRLVHRGPDAEGTWHDEAAGVALGHRRLSILDLSPAGAQPMVSASARHVIVFNGEIYNHPELRRALEIKGVDEWRGASDTETLLAAIEAWGLDPALSRCLGMFAFALWDRKSRMLHLARDRFGEKPLYYGWAGGAFVFGSELKALRACPGFDAPVCRAALAQYLRFTYVPAPRTIHPGIFKLEPGCILTVEAAPPRTPPDEPLRPGERFGSLSIRRYWSLAATIEAGARDPVRDETEGLERLEAALIEAVRRQMLSDVPLGAFLSGGVDSSTIVALMQQHGGRTVQTFTVGVADAALDESPYARAVARHLGTAHTEIMVTEPEMRDVVPSLPSLYDEPFADSSQIPTHWVCRAARTRVTVALSGDGGDELFGGYNRYFWGPRIWRHFNWIPFPARRALGGGIRTLPVGGWDALGGLLNRLRPGTGGIARLGDKAHRLGARLSHVQDMTGLYRSLVSEWRDPASLILPAKGGVIEPSSLLDDPLPAFGLADPVAQMMYRDAMTYLPDDILCKVDRAAMGISLETRAPFLDHHVAELAWRLPLAMKIRGNEGKWALRQILYKYVPREMIERPKMGFAIPVHTWLRGPLREWAESLLDGAQLRQQQFFDPAPIRRIWAEHVSGRRDWTTRLWTILMFQAWLEENG